MMAWDDFSFGDLGGSDLFSVDSYPDIFTNTGNDSFFDVDSWYSDTDLSFTDSGLFDLSYDDLYENLTGEAPGSSGWNTALNVGGKVFDAAAKVGTGTVDLVKSAMNSPGLLGMIGGAADGYSAHQLLELEEEKLKMLQDEVARKNDLNDKHNASLQTPHEDITKRIRRI